MKRFATAVLTALAFVAGALASTAPAQAVEPESFLLVTASEPYCDGPIAVVDLQYENRGTIVENVTPQVNGNAVFDTLTIPVGETFDQTVSLESAGQGNPFTLTVVTDTSERTMLESTVPSCNAAPSVELFVPFPDTACFVGGVEYTVGAYLPRLTNPASASRTVKVMQGTKLLQQVTLAPGEQKSLLINLALVGLQSGQVAYINFDVVEEPSLLLEDYVTLPTCGDAIGMNVVIGQPKCVNGQPVMDMKYQNLYEGSTGKAVFVTELNGLTKFTAVTVFPGEEKVQTINLAGAVEGKTFFVSVDVNGEGLDFYNGTVPYCTKPILQGTITVYASAYAVGYVGTCKAAYSKTPNNTWTYQWLRDGVVQPGKTGRTYAFTASDYKHRVSCRTTAKNPLGSTVNTSYAYYIGVGPALKPIVGKYPKITGTPKVGYTLKAYAGSWTPSATSYSYQWYNNGRKITGATKSYFKVRSSDRGDKITVRVYAKRYGYKTGYKTTPYVRPR